MGVSFPLTGLSVSGETLKGALPTQSTLSHNTRYNKERGVPATGKPIVYPEELGELTIS